MGALDWIKDLLFGHDYGPEILSAIEGTIAPPLYPNGYQTAEVYLVRIQYGMAQTRQDSATYDFGGPAPHERLADRFGTWLTQETFGPGNWTEGSFWDYASLPMEKEVNRRAEYIELVSDNANPICISAITVASPQGDETTITGNLLRRRCGWNGYPSVTDVTIGETTFQPDCLWLGSLESNATNNAQTVPQRMTFHLPDFTGERSAEAYKENMDLLCKAPPRAWRWGASAPEIPVFEPALRYAREGSESESSSGSGSGAGDAYDAEVVLDPKHWATSDGARQPKIRPLTGIPELGLPRDDKRRRDSSGSGFDGAEITERYSRQYSLVDSAAQRYSAKVICGDLSIVGPDWANKYEALYCDLSSRQLYPFCETEEDGSCFDAEEAEIRGEAPSSSGVMSLFALSGAGRKAGQRSQPVKRLDPMPFDFGKR